MIVVGAGPAGSIAGFYAARSGLRVLIVDKAEFPRHKPCAGGLTTKALMRLPFSISEIVERTTDTVKLSRQDRRPLTLSAGGVVCGFVQRDLLDPLLLSAAIAEGCAFQKIDRLGNVICGPDNVVITTDSMRVTASYLIAADGANSQVRRIIKPGFGFRRGFAIEGIVPASRLSTCRICSFASAAPITGTAGFFQSAIM